MLYCHVKSNDSRVLRERNNW